MSEFPAAGDDDAVPTGREVVMANFLASNWPLLLLLAVFFLMHRSGGGCGTHGHGHHQHDSEPKHDARHDHDHRDTNRPPDAESATPAGNSHTHRVQAEAEQ
jgi:hypothetical protein